MSLTGRGGAGSFKDASNVGRSTEVIGPLSSAAEMSEETVSAHNLFSDTGAFDGANIASLSTL